MKNLVVYYSLEGNTKLIAEFIAKEIGADIIELKPKKNFHLQDLESMYGEVRV